MSLASWFSLPKFQLPTNRNHSPWREPLHTRPRVEQLEDRLLLTAGSSNQQGLVNNPTINFNAPSIGLTLPNNSQGGNPLAVSQFVNTQQSTSIGAQANLLAQGQVTNQFRSFSVNSQGQGNEYVGNQTQFQATAMGFGSGVMPNAPWMPAAYNLGLANHQFANPSMLDNGFGSSTAWFDPPTQPVRDAQGEPDGGATRYPELMSVTQSTSDNQHDFLQPIPENIWAEFEEKYTDTQDSPIEQETEKELRRGDPEVEETLFSAPSALLPVEMRVSRFSNNNRSLDENQGAMEGESTETTSIASPLLLSAVEPAQLAALVAGLPGILADSEGTDASMNCGTSD